MYEPITERSVVQQLDDLPEKAVVVDRDGDAWQKKGGGGWSMAGANSFVGVLNLACSGPLVLVYNPDHHR